MKIIHLSAECYPVAKVGGLADVVGALPKYQSSENVTSEVIMPFYDNKFTQEHAFSSVFNSTLKLGEEQCNFEILTLDNNSLGFNIYFVKIPNLLTVDYVYSFDDANRFLAFQIAILDWILTWNEKPTIFHCHDHHTGLTPFMLQESYKYESLNAIPVILTIHNAQYQGWFSHDKVGTIPDFNFDNVGLLDWGESINPLAAAIKCAWAVTTVSPSYMEELKENANGLESLLASESAKCSGILNGIDTDVWNPETDSYIVKNFKKTTVVSGRKGNKTWLCNEFNLDPKKPLFAFIGRLVGEKGAELLPSVFDKALENKNISVLLLGSGHDEIEEELNLLKVKHKGSYNAYIGYDEKLSHIIYAGADFLLMPSRVEPCGLNQLYSLRYGLIPIVRKIGGLKDTIIDVENDGFGFTHDDVDIDQIVSTMNRATKLFEDSKEFTKNRKYIMGIDHSWDASAEAYLKLYQSLKK
ncbi:glycogen synthase [Urechidicola vernalis]|uniref:Glycogen synthase n=1 Tax=Urechidicola vernalis TaxID=3075600 RepID=A0ABU2Y5Z7_9FLAO|nr:glycogen/starch synthase [Urechidicola sp. P050]MDT0553467.1 glycogen/starch synthase [Urechidicola sp. P050]